MSEIKVENNDYIFTSTDFRIKELPNPVEYSDVIYFKKDTSSSTYLINFLYNGKKLKREVTALKEETPIIDEILKGCKMRESFETRSLIQCSKNWLWGLAIVLFVCGLSMALQTGSIDRARVRTIFVPFIYLGYYLGVKVLTIVMIAAVIITILAIIISYLQKKEVVVFTNTNHN